MKELDNVEQWLVAVPPDNTVLVGVGVDLAEPLADVPYVPLAIDRSLAATGREPKIVRLVVHGGRAKGWALSTRAELEEYVRPVTEPAIAAAWDQLREAHQALRRQTGRVSGAPGCDDLISRACRVIWLCQENDALVAPAVRALELLTSRVRGLMDDPRRPTDGETIRTQGGPAPATSRGEVIDLRSASVRPEDRVPPSLGPQRPSRGVAR